MDKNTYKIIILICFFLSGFASLIYEVVWIRMLVLIFGATTLAVSTVLTVFMGGLALGSVIFGRTVSRWGNPLLVYAILELAIGGYGLLIPKIFPHLIPIYQIIWEGFHHNFYLFSLFRFFLISVVLMIPTTLMGATLPVLGQYFSSYESQAGRYLGLLYGLNTLGAVLGAYSTGFLILPALGVDDSTLVAAIGNFIVGILALFTSRLATGQGSSRGQSVPMRSAPLRPSTHSRLTPRAAVVVVLCFGLSGFAAMVYEVAWSRALSLVMGSTLYAFSAMLTTFLVGLALGSLIASLFVERFKQHLKVLAILQVLIGLSAFLTLNLIGMMPFLFTLGYQSWSSSGWGLSSLWFVISFMIMFAPTLLLGTLFPFVVKLFQGRLPGMGRLAGDIYAVNTVGAILGAFCAGFILIPQVGIQTSVMIGIFLNMAIALMLLLSGHDSHPERSMVSSRALSVFVILLALGMVYLKPAWNAHIMTSGVFLKLTGEQDLPAASNRKAFDQALARGREVLYYKEGITATIIVEREPGIGISLRINGRREAGERFMRTQVLLAHIPILLSLSNENRIEKVLVIGWGSGSTVGSILRYPVKSVKAVELEPVLVKATPFFNDINHRPLEDPRVETIINDGRNYLLVTDDDYDVIVSQPSLPWITGASNLFTKEFFELGAKRLKPKGVFAQWLTTDAIAVEDFRSVVKAFQAAFPYVLIFETTPGDVLIIGTKEQLVPDVERIEAFLAHPEIAKDLARIQVAGVYDLFTLYLFGKSQMEEFLRNAPINTDDNAYIELFGPHHYYQTRSSVLRDTNLKTMLTHFMKELSHGEGLWDREEPSKRETLYLKLAESSLSNNLWTRAGGYAEAALRVRPSPQGYYLRGKTLATRAEWMDIKDPQSHVAREQLLHQARQDLETALAMDPEIIPAKFTLGLVYAMLTQYDRAIEAFERALQGSPGYLEVHYNLALAYEVTRQLQKAKQHYQQFLELASQSVAFANFRLIAQKRLQEIERIP